MCRSDKPAGGTDRERVHRRSQLAQRPQQLGCLLLAHQAHGFDDRERLTAQELGDVLERWELEQPPDRGHLLGHARNPLAPGVQDLGGAIEREEENARVDLADGEQVELERRDDAEVAAAAAQRPEQLGLVVAIGPQEPAIRGHELDRRHAARGQAELAGVPAHSAAERVAGDADVGRRAMQRGQAHLRGARHDVPPLRAATHAGALPLTIDLDVVERVGLHEDRVFERPERPGVVACALWSHAVAVVAREPHDGRHVLRVDRQRNRRGTLVDHQVERLAGGVEALVAGTEDLALAAGAQLGDVDRGGFGHAGVSF